MNPSWRKPAGMLLMLALIAIWAIAAVTLIDALAAPFWLASILYIVAGIAWIWVLPMRRLLRWMELGTWRN